MPKKHPLVTRAYGKVYRQTSLNRGRTNTLAERRVYDYENHRARG
jgi:hypothetical protein